MVVRRLLVSLVLGWSVLASLPARAEPPEHALRDRARSHRLWLRGIGYTGKLDGERVVMIAPRFGGAFLLGDKVDLDIEVPLTVANIDVATQKETEMRTMPANPFVGASYVADVRGSLFTLGLGATVPLARDDEDDRYDQLAFALARAARAGRESWLYTPDRMAVVMSSGFETRIRRGPLLALDAAVAIMPRVRGEGSALTSTSQLGLALSALLGDSVQLGGRIDAVLLSADERERLQSALVPFLHVSTRDGVLFAAELIMNLDSPHGFAFAKEGVWGASLLAGSRF